MFTENLEHWDVADEAALKRTQNCSDYFNVVPVLFQNVEVKEYEEAVMEDIKSSIAFNIMVHSQAAMFELFLALYFRPHDHYVIHLDKKVKFELIPDNIISFTLSSN